MHDGVGGTVVDYNRGGVPLIEIVTEPDISSAEEAVAFLETLKNTISYTGISDVKMEEGSLRCDVNLSVKPKGSDKLGTRTEMKNLNSFKAVYRAINYEQRRQIEEIEDGNKIIQQTLRWDDSIGETKSMRNKEDSQDYRYFPDPDLLPVKITDSEIENIKNSLPVLPTKRFENYLELGLSEYDANLLISSKTISDFFNEVNKQVNNAKLVANWVINEVLRKTEDNNILISVQNFSELLIMVSKSEISSTAGKQVLEQLWGTNKTAAEVVEKLGLKQISNTDELKQIVQAAINNNPKSVADYKGGNEKAIGFLVGQVMKESKGKANPQIVNKLLKELLD